MPGQAGKELLGQAVREKFPSLEGTAPSLLFTAKNIP